MTWGDLSDSELRSRLRNRGVDDTRVVWWVGRREHEEEARKISDVLGEPVEEG